MTGRSSATLGVGFNSINWTNPAFGKPRCSYRDGLGVPERGSVSGVVRPGRSRPSPAPLNVPPAWGAQINNPNGGRPARMNQWNVSVQRRADEERDRRGVVARQPRRLARGEQSRQPQCDAITKKFQQLRRSESNDPADRTLPDALANRFGPRGLARVQGAVHRLPGGATVAQTLRPFPQLDCACAVQVGALRQHVVRRPAPQPHEAAVAPPQSDRGVRVAERRGTGERRLPRRGGRANRQTFRSRGTAIVRRELTAVHLRDELKTTRRRTRPARSTAQSSATERSPAWFAPPRRADCSARRRTISSRSSSRTPTWTPGGGSSPLFVEGTQLQMHRPARARGLVARSRGLGRSAPGRFGVSSAYHDDYRWRRQARREPERRTPLQGSAETSVKSAPSSSTFSTRTHLRCPKPTSTTTRSRPAPSIPVESPPAVSVTSTRPPRRGRTCRKRRSFKVPVLGPRQSSLPRSASSLRRLEGGGPASLRSPVGAAAHFAAAVGPARFSSPVGLGAARLGRGGERESEPAYRRRAAYHGSKVSRGPVGDQLCSLDSVNRRSGRRGCAPRSRVISTTPRQPEQGPHGAGRI